MFLFLFLIPASASAQDTRQQLHEIHSGNLTVAYPDGLEDEARHIIDIYPSVRARLVEKLGLPANVSHTIVIVTNYDAFVQIAGTSLVVAFAEGSRRLVVLDYSAVARQPAALTDNLTHELCHLVLYEYVTTGGTLQSDVLLPRWLNEGICQWASGGINELALVGQGSELENAVLGGRLIALRRLERAFPGDDRGMHLAYEESLSAVRYIADQHGRGVLLKILEELRKGQGIDFAIKNALGATYTQFEEKWQASLRLKHTWFRWLSNNLLALIFAVGGALLSLGFLRAIWRYWHYRDEDEFSNNDASIAPPSQAPRQRRLRSRNRRRHVLDDKDHNGPKYRE